VRPRVARAFAGVVLVVALVILSAVVPPFSTGASATSPTGSSTSATITAVGGLADVVGTGASSLPVTPRSLGDALVLTVKVSSASSHVASVSGGGAASWSKLVGFASSSSTDMEIWLGTVTTPGGASITVAYSSSVATRSVELTAQEFTAGLGAATVWAKDSAGGQDNTSSVTIASPALTPTATGELYLSYSRSPGQVLAGSTSGFTYDPTALGNMVLYDPGVTGAVAPTSLQSPAATSSSVGALVTVS